MKGLSSESLSLLCSKGRMWCNFLTALHILVINSNNDKANMLILLFSAFRKEFPSKDVREWPLLVHLCSTLIVLSSATLQKRRRHIWIGQGSGSCYRWPRRLFQLGTLLMNIHLLSTIPPKRGKIAHFLWAWGMRIYFKDDYNLMFTVIINYSRPSGMQVAKLQRNWSVRGPANRTYGYCVSFGHLMF